MEYIATAQTWLLSLLNAAQWHTYVLVLIVVSVIVEIVKRFFSLRGSKSEKNVYRITIVTGLVVTIVAFYTVTVAQPVWYWGFLGITVGHISNWLYRKTSPFLFKILFRVFPWLEKRNTDRSGAEK